MSIEEIVNIAVQWGPTALVAVIMIFAFLMGIFRGFRKSTILAINAIVAFVIVFSAYIWLVTEPIVDEYVVTYTNQILSAIGQGSLQSLLGASSSASTLKEILTEIIPTYMDLGEGVSTVVQDNGVYLGALVNSAYHLVFAIILWIVYLVLVFIFYIFYLIFLPERRYKKKKDKLYIACKGTEYKKRRLLGGLVGSLRGVVASLVFLSFFGTLLFIVTGGDGTGEREEVTFGDEKLDEYYDIYEAVGEYGNYGIYSFLNQFKDKNNVPYYLFAADLVLSGSFEDRENNINAEIVYREELACYVKFARSTVELLLKYGAEDITPLLNGEEGDITLALSNTFAKEGFKEEFEVIIDEFEEDTFFINFALSAVDSIARNINDFNFSQDLDPQVRDILNILLVGDPEEVITVSNIINKNDAKILLSSVISVMAEGQTQESEEETLNSTQRTLSLVKGVLPQITQLSIFTDEKKVEKGNKILANVYDYVIESLSNNEAEEIKVITSDEIMKLTNKKPSQINWMGELVDLINVGSDAIGLYEDNYKEEDPISGLLHMLDENNPNKITNKESLDNIIDALSKSEILGLALSTTFVNDMLVDALSSIAEGFVLPQDVDYVRQFNADGSVKVEGEIYTLLKSAEMLLENGFADFYDKMQSEEGFEDETEQIIELANLLLKEVDNNGTSTSVVDTLLDSKMLKYTLSQVLTSVNIEGVSIVIPEVCQEDVPEDIIVIKNEKLKSLVSNLSVLLPEDGEELINISKIYDNKDKILENEILHATIVVLLVDTLASGEAAENIIIPEEYKVTKEELTTNYANNIWVQTSEVKLILDALNAVLDLSTLDINNINLDSIKISKESVSIALESVILHATVSNIVSDTLAENEITVPTEALEDNCITKAELTNLVGALEVVLGTDENGININNINLDSISINKGIVPTVLDSIILHSAVSKIVSDTLAENEITVPTEAKEGDYITKVELTNLVGALEVVLGTDENGININNINLDSISISKGIVPTVLESIILHSAVSKIVSDTLADNEITVPTEAKEGDYITKTEITSLVGGLEVVLGADENGININNINLDSISISKTTVTTALDSIILHSAVSKIVSDTLADNEITVPTEAKEGDYITKTEITNLVGGLEVVLGADENGININNINLDSISISKTTVTTALDSIILHSTVSKYVTDALTDNEITVPTEAMTGDYISKTEIESLIGALEVVLETGEDGIQIDNVNFESIKIKKVTISTVLESIILHSTVSKYVTDALTDNEITVPTEAKEGNYITKVEITNLIGALEVVLETGEDGIQIDNIDFESIKISKTTIPTVLESIILHSTVSKLVTDSLTDNEITVPTEAKEGDYITKVEITNLIGALEVVLETGEDGIQMDNVDFESIKISKTTISIVLESIILHSTVSKYVTDALVTSNIEIPNEVQMNNYIIKVEITNLVSALELILGSGEDGIQINNFNIENISLRSSDIDVLFDSKIIQRKVTTEVKKAFDKPLVDQVYVDSSRKDILKEEASKLLLALETILPNSENGIDFNNVDVANIEISGDKVEVAYSSTIFAQIISDNILTNGSIAGKIPTTAISQMDYTVPNENGTESIPAAIITKEEVVNLIRAIETLFDTPLSANTSFDINSAIISYGSNGSGNLMTILNSRIVECMISDTIIGSLVYVPTTCLEEVSIYNSVNKANIINKNELCVLVQIIGNNNNDTYEISVGEQMEFNEFDRQKIEFIKKSEIGRYKVSEILLAQQSLIVPVESLEEIECLGLSGNTNILETSEFGKLLDALNAVIPGGNGFNNIEIQMPTNKDDYEVVSASDILRATITNKLEINGKAVFLENDLELGKYSKDGNIIPVLTASQLENALVAVNALNGSNSNEFTATIDIQTLASLDSDTLSKVLRFNMIRYEVSELLKKIPTANGYEKELVYTYTIKTVDDVKIVEKSANEVEVFTITGIEQFIETFRNLYI